VTDGLAVALAHAGQSHLDAGTVLRWWTFSPLVVPLLAASGASYALGLRRLWSRLGTGGGIRSWEAVCFGAGWLSLWIALVSPLDRLSDILFSAHMAQHEILMVVAAPLLVIGRPFLPVLWSLPAAGREALGGWARRPAARAMWGGMTGPFVVLVVHAAAVWVWHVPALFEAALRSEAVHGLQHLSFFWTAALFWWALVQGGYGRLGYGVATLFVFATSVHTSVLGALLTFASVLWYPMYAGRGAAWGVSPLEDQQLAGLYMWVPSGLTFLVLGLALVAAWMGEAERRVALGRPELAGTAAGRDA
jgi:cytochrome c oxidase assembly factor CtaG